MIYINQSKTAASRNRSISPIALNSGNDNQLKTEITTTKIIIMIKKKVSIIYQNLQ